MRAETAAEVAMGIFRARYADRKPYFGGRREWFASRTLKPVPIRLGRLWVRDVVAAKAMQMFRKKVWKFLDEQPLTPVTGLFHYDISSAYPASMMSDARRT